MKKPVKITLIIAGIAVFISCCSIGASMFFHKLLTYEKPMDEDEKVLFYTDYIKELFYTDIFADLPCVSSPRRCNEVLDHRFAETMIFDVSNTKRFDTYLHYGQDDIIDGRYSFFHHYLEDAINNCEYCKPYLDTFFEVDDKPSEKYGWFLFKKYTDRSVKEPLIYSPAKPNQKEVFSSNDTFLMGLMNESSKELRVMLYTD